jgi:predicted esterase
VKSFGLKTRLIVSVNAAVLPRDPNPPGRRLPPVFIGQGLADGPARAEAARDTLSGRGYDVTFRTYDTDHTVTREMIAGVVQWISGGR